METPRGKVPFPGPHSCWADEPAPGRERAPCGPGGHAPAARSRSLAAGPVLSRSFGIQHDGSGNDCEAVGKRPFIMSPQLLYDTVPLTWSRCSREYITRFLE